MKALLASSALLATAPALAQTVTTGGDVTSNGATVTPGPQTSPWNTSALHVGDTGSGTLYITDGGTTSNTGSVSIGNSAGSIGSVTVDGSGSQLTSTSSLTVGYTGSGTLAITNAGVVSDTDGVVGQLAGSTGTVTIDGVGSKWTNTGTLAVGTSGIGTLEITTGGMVSNTIAYIGTTSNGSAPDVAGRGTGSVVVSGPGSQWNNNGILYLGSYGTGTLAIINGGIVSNTNGVIGRTVGTTGTATVSGVGSQWNNSLELDVGGLGTGTLTISDSGAVSVTSATTIASAAGSIGTLNIGAGALNGVPDPAVAPGTLNTPTVTFGAGTADLVFNHTSSDYEFAPVITGGGATTSAVDVLAGTTVMTGIGSDYFGNTTVYDGAVLAAGAANVFSPNSDYVLQDPGTLDLRGFSQTVGSLTNAGVVNMGTNTAPGTILTVNGNYVGDGGIIIFNTKLGDDNSPTDKMVVNGTTSGQTGVKIVNAGGLGAQTNGNGIEIIEVTNGISASAGTFSLVGPVAAGAYDYGLFQNGTSNTDGNWYLRSTMRREVPVDSSETPSVSIGGLQLMGDSNDRGGGIGYDGYADEFCDDGQPNQLYTKVQRDDTGCHSTALWGRVFGEYGNQGGGSSKADGTPAYDYGIYGIQTGGDLYRSAHDKAGVYFSYGRMDNTVYGFDGSKAGTLGYDAYAFGGYWTHLYGNGWYTDLALQGAWYEDLQTKTNGVESFSTHGTSVTAQGEAGKWIGLGDGWAVIPKAAIVYQTVDLAGGSDGVALISFATTNEIYGRIGARLTKDLATPALPNIHAMQVYGEFNMWDQLGDRNSKTTFSNLQGSNPTTVTSLLGGSWAQLKAGISGQVTKDMSVFVAVDGNIALDHTGYAVGGHAGLKVSF